MGGVDFSKSPKQNVSKQQFTAKHQYLPRSTRTSVQTMTDDAESDELLLLGGNTKAKPTTGDTAKPPADGASGGGQAGGLPITGDSVPVPALVSAALALIIAGTALAWWGRRRCGAPSSARAPVRAAAAPFPVPPLCRAGRSGGAGVTMSAWVR
nr:hypothetical protein GCM10020092_075910 [Actinoplanes digitatis]